MRELERDSEENNSYLVLKVLWRKVALEKSGKTDGKETAGDNDGEGPPVPIPNTAVKLTGAEDTWMVTSRENRASPALKDSWVI